jgi:copper(I)-binding protein
MLTGLGEKLVEGDTLPLSLTFEHAGTVALEVPIRGVGAGMSHGDHQRSTD